MKLIKIALSVLVLALSTGCVTMASKKLRNSIPVGYAGEVEGEVVLTGGGGAGFSGKNVSKPSKNVITADEWSEYAITPWGKTKLILKNAGIGIKKPVVVVEEAPSAVQN